MYVSSTNTGDVVAAYRLRKRRYQRTTCIVSHCTFDGWLWFNTHRQRGHLETARFSHRPHRESNPIKPGLHYQRNHRKSAIHNIYDGRGNLDDGSVDSVATYNHGSCGVLAVMCNVSTVMFFAKVEC